jgi:carbon-monoxide dehydrogenase large subunit
VVVNAVVDALKDYGVTHLEMPVTPERVWRAMRETDKVASEAAKRGHGVM